MPSSHVLVIDDEPALRQILATALGKAGYWVEMAAGAEPAMALLAGGDFDVALCDIRMPDGSGLDVLRRARAAGIDTTFVMITASTSLETAVEALRAGAHDYILKPVRKDELLHRLAQIEAMRGLREENKVLRRAVGEKTAPALGFRSPGMLAVSRLASKVAPTDSTVLITGESGTGKGVLAQAIHQQSPRAEQAFVPVNCSAIPETLMESELFGHTKGAFTGADRTRKGLFLEADRGTLFLDEIGELPMPMQTKLLHAIESKKIRAVGSEQQRQVDIRIVAATNRDLKDMIAQGRFRDDLYFRLSMFQIAVPPLRERPEDIRDLVRFLLQRGAGPDPASALEIDSEAEAYLLAYAWPGNVRELENVITRARIVAEGPSIGVADLPAALVDATTPRLPPAPEVPDEGGLREQLQKVELQIITAAIAAAQGDRRLAAQRLRISLSSLYRKLGEHTATD
ncbi:MAG TPA: sigma-54 dependent transcriptional regulator [Burkholderiaceae bacterium]|nr:sigma-54 dependent transcriptional regulator [Burkholderiaceae bacterium]